MTHQPRFSPPSPDRFPPDLVTLAGAAADIQWRIVPGFTAASAAAGLTGPAPALFGPAPRTAALALPHLHKELA